MSRMAPARGDDSRCYSATDNATRYSSRFHLTFIGDDGHWLAARVEPTRLLRDMHLMRDTLDSRWSLPASVLYGRRPASMPMT